MDHDYALIMAGGGGTRLWPLSRRSRPKQSLRLLGERTVFQVSVERLAPLFPPERILVVTNAAYAQDLQQQCPHVPAHNYILEPAPRGTGPAIGLAAVAIGQRDPAAVIACLTADHFIGNEAGFRDLLAAAALAARQDYLVTLGVRPTYPATGFGYIQRGAPVGTFGGFSVYRAERFKEKPGLQEAQAMVADGLHSWNSGMFVWRVNRILEEFLLQLPDVHALLLEMAASPAALPALWERVPNVTIDYGIMEGAQQVAVISADALGWNDIGSWESLFEVLEPDSAGNVVIGAEHLGLETTGTLVHSGAARLVATIGLSGLVVVDTGDVLLICPRERSQDVRKIVERLKQRNDGKRYL